MYKKLGIPLPPSFLFAPRPPGIVQLAGGVGGDAKDGALLPVGRLQGATRRLVPAPQGHPQQQLPPKHPINGPPKDQTKQTSKISVQIYSTVQLGVAGSYDAWW